MKTCEHCGRCCKSGISCLLGQILFDITDDNPQPCPAIEQDDDGYWCGLIRNPIQWFSPLVGNVSWKCEAMGDIARIYIGIGDSRSMSPTKRKIILRLKKYIR